MVVVSDKRVKYRRRWTDDDEVEAEYLGWGLISADYEPFVYQRHMDRDFISFGMLDVRVWLLAEAGEPTAIKALDIIEERNPAELKLMFRNYMKFTGGNK